MDADLQAQKLKNDIDVKCSFCLSLPETRSHWFWYCKFTHELWNEIKKCIAASIFPDFVLYYKNVLFGYCDHSSKDDNAFFLVNLILLLAKFHIHKCKFTNKKQISLRL